GQRSVRHLRADGDQPDAALGQRGHELRLVGAQGDVAVGAPAAAVEHDDGGLAAKRLGGRGRLAGDIEEVAIWKPVGRLGYAGRLARSSQGPLLGRERLGNFRGELSGRRAVIVGDLLGDGGCGGHGRASLRKTGLYDPELRNKIGMSNPELVRWIYGERPR